jgi:hypothetical protein
MPEVNWRLRKRSESDFKMVAYTGIVIYMLGARLDPGVGDPARLGRWMEGP